MTLYNLREVHYEVESAGFPTGADIGDGSTLTYTGGRLPIISASFSPEHEKRQQEGELSRRDDAHTSVLGERSGKLEIEVYLCGHNTAPTGAVTKTWLPILLEAAFGGYSAGTGTTAVKTASDTDTIVTAATTSWAAGQLGRLGIKNDARGDGQAFRVSSVAATPTRLELATGIPAAPEDADVVYPMMCIYPSPGNEKTVRFLVAHAESNAQWHACGCQLESISFSVDNQGDPKATLSYVVGYWVRYGVTTPSATACEACSYAPCMAGSVYVSANSTRAVVTADSFAFRLETGLVVKKAPVASQLPYQTIYGYERTATTPYIEYTKAWATADEALYDSDGASTPMRRILATRVPVAGKALAIYMPNAYLVSPRPAPSDNNGILSHKLVWRGREDSTGATDLAKASWVLGLG